ncbi:MAG: hypothetical protein JXR76_02275 [Deltaproteobacteria bacterium]|nr:hypothetical protein [Deltaproteobacteria bacterium]
MFHVTRITQHLFLNIVLLVVLTCGACGRISFEDGDTSHEFVGDGDTDADSWVTTPTDTETEDTAPDNTLHYSGPTEAISIAPPDGERFIDSAGNSAGVQGIFYAYSDDTSSIAVSNSAGGFFYLSGQVAAAPPNEYMYIGMGTGLCFDTNDTYYPIGNCPFAPQLADQMVGISFEMTGTYPLFGVLEITFICTSTGNMLYWRIPATGEHEVLFSDMQVRQPNIPFTAGDIDRVQFQLSNTTQPPISYDFFLGNFKILMRAD